MSKQAINEDCWQLRDYKVNEESFSKEGFTFPVAKRCLPIAILFAWDAYHLFFRAKRIPMGGIYLEIGSCLGGSLICAYMATQISGSSVSFIAIDPFIGDADQYAPSYSVDKNQFLENTKSIPHLRLIEDFSDVVKDQIDDSSVDLLFVDGSHQHEQVKRDLKNYWPKVKTNGVLLGHDYNAVHPGVIRAADEVFGKEKLTLLENSSMWIVKK